MSRVDPLTVAVYPGGKSVDERPAPGSPEAKAAGQCNLVQGAGGYFPGAIDLDCFRFPEDRYVKPTPVPTGMPRNGVPKREAECPAPSGLTAYARAVGCLRERNRLTALLLKASDDVCVREMGSLTADQATVNTSLNVLASAATTVANIVTGDQAKAILTGTGGFATATRSHISADVYRNTVSYAISRAIVIERKRLRDLIEARYVQPTATFTIDDAIRAANEYHGVCSFYRGLELVLASVEGDQRTRDAQARREQIEGLERQIIQYRALMANPAKGEDTSVYAVKIKELVDRIQALTLAATSPDVDPALDPAMGSGQDGITPTTTDTKSKSAK